MNKDKIKGKDIRFFILPLIALLLFFAIGTTVVANINVNEYFSLIEKSTLDIARSYATSLTNATDAGEKIRKLLDEKMTAIVHAIINTKSLEDEDTLNQVGNKFGLDELYVYKVIDGEPTITHSYSGKYIGWTAPKGHPVHNFMLSDKDYLVEEIRKDSDSDLYYKYAYKKGKNNTFIQIGILAESVHSLLQKFTVEEMISDFMKISGVQNAIFMYEDKNYVVAQDSEKIKKFIDGLHLGHNEIVYAKTIIKIVDGSRILHVCAPVYLEDEKIGVLTIVWDDNYIDEKVQWIFYQSGIAFIIVALAVGVILYYAYKKDKKSFDIAFFDNLTGLPNFEYLKRYLDFRIKTIDDVKTSILLVNCVNFRIVNLTYGFGFGNQTIAKIANLIKELQNENVTLFRLGEDRFVFVVENYIDTNSVISFARKVIERFKKLTEGDHMYEFVVPEVSIYEIKDSDITVDNALKYASLALNTISLDLNENIAIYSCEMEELVQREAKIEKALRAIIQREDTDSLSLVFQPQVDLETNKTTGFEALARLNNEELGNVSPVEFIAIAEKRMLIYDLGNLIFEKACDFLKTLQNEGFDNISIAVNISVVQLLRDDFLGALKRIISEKGVSPDLIEFEITESVFMENFNIANEKIKNIKKLGIKVSLDDFGTGYSSFARLGELSIDSIKIDKHIIEKITHKNEENLIAADLISMAHKMGLYVVAEGVEEEEQKIYLRENDCDIIQGYYCSKPLDSLKAVDYLKQVNNNSLNLIK